MDVKLYEKEKNMKLGMIIACEDGIITELEKLTKSNRIEKGCFDVLEYDLGKNQVYAILSGVGEIMGAAATELLIACFGVDKIINVGVVGALKEDFPPLTVTYVKDVVHYDFDTSVVDNCPVGKYVYFDSEYVSTDEEFLKDALKIKRLPKVRCASADKFVEGEKNKTALRERYDADICDMESAGVLITCKRNAVPCLMIKAVSDSHVAGIEMFNELKLKASLACMEIVKALLDR